MTNSSPDLWSRCSYWSKVVNAKWVFSLFPLRDVKIPVRLQMEVSRMSCHFQSAQFTCYLLISCCSLFSWFERACIITPSLLFADFHNWNNNIQLTVPHPCNSSILHQLLQLHCTEMFRLRPQPACLKSTATTLCDFSTTPNTDT